MALINKGHPNCPLAPGEVGPKTETDTTFINRNIVTKNVAPRIPKDRFFPQSEFKGPAWGPLGKYGGYK